MSKGTLKEGMGRKLPSSESIKHRDFCNGIHGAARARRGMKKARNDVRRCQDRLLERNYEEDV